MKPRSPINRRQFLGQASCAAVGSTALFSTLMNLRMASAAALDSDPADYKALVCVFLFGGNDSWNVLVPKGASDTAPEYVEYTKTRKDLALDRAGVHTLNTLNSDGRIFGVHNGLKGLADLYNSGKLAFVSNVGSLMRPTTLSDFQKNLNVPYGLFSHSSQQQQWQTSICDRSTEIGWAGRAADLLYSMNGNSSVSMNLSLNGTNIFQTGRSVFSYGIGTHGAPTLYSNTDYKAAILRETALNSQMDVQYKNLFEQTFSQQAKNSIEGNLLFNDAVAGITLDPTIDAAFPKTYFGDQLKMASRVIAARKQLGVKRQTFFIGWGGFDYHSALKVSMNGMMPELSAGVTAFNNAMVNLSEDNNVTLFQVSDFGRTLTSNNGGADHAWGGNAFVVGGAVNGQKIYGTYPSLGVGAGNPLDTGQGRLIPTTSVDQFAAELALWLGVSQANLDQVLPNIRTFYSGIGQPLGFMKM